MSRRVPPLLHLALCLTSQAVSLVRSGGGQGKVQEPTNGLPYQYYNIRLQIKLVFVTRGRLYISACEHGMIIVHGIAVREALGGCATSPPTMHNNQTLAWQRCRASLKTPDIQHFLPICPKWNPSEILNQAKSDKLEAPIADLPFISFRKLDACTYILLDIPSMC